MTIAELDTRAEQLRKYLQRREVCRFAPKNIKIDKIIDMHLEKCLTFGVHIHT